MRCILLELEEDSLATGSTLDMSTGSHSGSKEKKTPDDVKTNDETNPVTFVSIHKKPTTPRWHDDE